MKRGTPMDSNYQCPNNKSFPALFVALVVLVAFSTVPDLTLLVFMLPDYKGPVFMALSVVMIVLSMMRSSAPQTSLGEYTLVKRATPHFINRGLGH
ncbi:hypothetical protein FLL45_01045 [Aliikangiella marina]|uniref:Uncharacterized protein n=1 Tax=Aliikangiella marina TaxID=1712262 RepID=A0A545THA2_9GAMM|nr:hypothetical protein [Aliikangiella marina]TQV76578.1 hypothetical protein FLL45_01045 [Aliikangiella marina]